MKQKKISVCYTNWNRFELLVNSFSEIHDHEAVGEICISDDNSDRHIFEQLRDVCSLYPKVKLYRNDHTKNCYLNKHTAASYATSEWISILDSDNKFGHSYFDAIVAQEWERDTALMPEFAMPHFSYEEFAGLTISKENVAQYMDRPMFRVMLNCQNYFINKELYLSGFDLNVNPNTADSIFVNYNILRNGGKIKIVDGLRYSHLVHADSHYNTQNHLTGNFLDEVEVKLRQLK